jgi:GTPase
MPLLTRSHSLVPGAADGTGLGQAFLRHVERCHVMLHLIDATSTDPVADYEMLCREIVRYGTGTLADMPQVVVVNKIDAYENHEPSLNRVTESWEQGLRVKWSRHELEARIRAVMPHTRLLWMSAKGKEGVDDVMERVAAFVHKVKDSKLKTPEVTASLGNR